MHQKAEKMRRSHPREDLKEAAATTVTQPVSLLHIHHGFLLPTSRCVIEFDTFLQKYNSERNICNYNYPIYPWQFMIDVGKLRDVLFSTRGGCQESGEWKK